MMPEKSESGRYVIATEIATGGMATVYLGRMLGAIGFARTVAIKKLHPQFAKDPEFVGMFVDEARLAARIQHPNVVQTLDVVVSSGEVLLVMEYIAGETLSRLARAAREAGQKIAPRIGATVVASALQGLHAAHEACDESGSNLAIVHRDVSPQNIVVGADGVSRVIDFGVAKAVSRMQTTGEGKVKGKLSYMAPEQLLSLPITRAADIFSAGVVLWEILTGERLLKADNEGQLVMKLLDGKFAPPSSLADVSKELDEVVLRALARAPEERWATALDMAKALERVVGTSSTSEIADWVKGAAGPALLERAARVRSLEQKTAGKAGVDDVLGALRDSQPNVLVAPATLDEMKPLAIAPDIDSMTGRPVTSPSFPAATAPVAKRGSGQLVIAALAAAIAIGGAGFGVWRVRGNATSPAAAPSAPPRAPSPSPLDSTAIAIAPATGIASASASASATAAAPTKTAHPPARAPHAATGDPYDSLGGRR
ncbi:MAG TPA: serine/threonine-protein kinase [Labilithrix sp.]